MWTPWLGQTLLDDGLVLQGTAAGSCPYPYQRTGYVDRLDTATSLHGYIGYDSSFPGSCSVIYLVRLAL